MDEWTKKLTSTTVAHDCHKTNPPVVPTPPAFKKQDVSPSAETVNVANPKNLYKVHSSQPAKPKNKGKEKEKEIWVPVSNSANTSNKGEVSSSALKDLPMEISLQSPLVITKETPISTQISDSVMLSPPSSVEIVKAPSSDTLLAPIVFSLHSPPSPESPMFFGPLQQFVVGLPAIKPRRLPFKAKKQISILPTKKLDDHKQTTLSSSLVLNTNPFAPLLLDCEVSICSSTTSSELLFTQGESNL
ncbi:unnamed protein product [Cochlearia groenlandica]